MADGNGSTPDRSAGGQDVGQGGVPVWLGWVLLVVAALVIAAQVAVSAERALTPLETALFNSLTVVIGLVGSVVVSGYYWRKQSNRDVENARENYQQLARPAWRRVVAIETSLGRIHDSIAEHAARLADDPEGKLIGPEAQAQWVDGLQRQVEHVGDHITAAIADWRELLPEDFAALVEEQARIAASLAELTERRQRMQELEHELSEKDALVTTLAANQGQAAEASAQEKEVAEAKARQLRADLDTERRRYRELAERVNRTSPSVSASGQASKAERAMLESLSRTSNHYESSRTRKVHDDAIRSLAAQGISPSVARAAADAVAAAAVLDSSGHLSVKEAQARAYADRQDDQEAERRGHDPRQRRGSLVPLDQGD